MRLTTVNLIRYLTKFYLLIIYIKVTVTFMPAAIRPIYKLGVPMLRRVVINIAVNWKICCDCCSTVMFLKMHPTIVLPNRKRHYFEVNKAPVYSGT